MTNTDCTVLVCSCDKYADVVGPFATLYRKYWSDCPFETVLVTETDLGQSGFDRTIACGGGLNWCEMLAMALSSITTPYVIMLMNDYYLTDPVNTSMVLSRLGQIKRFDAASLRLNPLPPGRRPWRDTDLLEMPKNVAYCVTCQVGIWNREFLLGLAKRNKSAWEFERYGSFQVGDERRPLLVTPTKEFPFIDAVHKGYWEKFGVKCLADNGIAYDFSKRGLPPFKVRLIEGLKALVFAVVPTTFLVKFQNRFSLGAKETPAEACG